jgi:uncharacterized iron-regulated protein
MRMTFRKPLLAALTALAALSAATCPAVADAPDRAAALAATCRAPGTWIGVKTGEAITPAAFFDGLMRRPVVLLGEHHDAAEHHRWQLQTLAALYGRGVKLVIGLEMIPRRLQPVLDRWVKGELTEKAFLDALEWRRVWGYDAELYLPLFHFARMNGVPLVALNVERALVSRVAAEGWAAVPEKDREGVTDPVPASAAYRRSLARVFARKEAIKAAQPSVRHGEPASLPATAQAEPPVDDKKLAEIDRRPEFQRFVEAQLVWDRAMAQGLAASKAKYADAQVVGLMGAGHVEYAHGVPHQLAALGIGDSAALIPVEAGEDCIKLAADYAEAVFTLKSPASTAEEHPRLGVMLKTEDGAALISGVIPDSVAAATGLLKGDRIVRAAGVPIRGPADLIEVMSRQAPGTWLPLTIRRGGRSIDLIAKFAPRKPAG